MCVKNNIKFFFDYHADLSCNSLGLTFITSYVERFTFGYTYTIRVKNKHNSFNNVIIHIFDEDIQNDTEMINHANRLQDYLNNK